MEGSHAVADLNNLVMTDDEARAAIGRRADFYLGKWQKTQHGGFNWAGFFLSGLWLPYRKMYVATAILFAAIIVESILEEAIFVYAMGMPAVPRGLERAVSLAVCWICGGFGNRWYFQHVAGLVATARASVPDESDRLEVLGRRGGTSVLAAVLCFGGFVTILFVSLIGLELVFGGAEDP
jgi:hypothetical protein